MKKFTSILLAILLVTACVPFAGAETEASEFSFITMSDIHHYATEYLGSMGDAVKTYFKGRNKIAEYQQPLYDAWAAAVRSYAADGVKYVVIPGDLAFNGEYASHAELAEMLKALEEETGVDIMVINGNHDINYKDSVSYATDSPEPAKNTTPQEFREIYADLGYDLACSTCTPSSGQAGMRSYAVSVEEGYRFIFIDAGKYSVDNTEKEQDVGETGGNITPELMEWVLAQIAEAKAAGEVPLGVTHWSVTPKDYLEEKILRGFVIDDRIKVADTLADAGMHFVFSGHAHDSDISSQITDNGEIIYDIMTDALSEYPHNFRINNFVREGEKITFLSDVLDVDCVEQVKVDGVKQPKPFKYVSYNAEYGTVLEDYAMNLLEGLLPGLFEDILAEGSIVAYVEKTAGISVKSLIRNLLTSDNEIVVGIVGALGVDWIADNIMALIADLDEQLCKKYLEDPYEVLSLLYQGIHDLGATEITDVPASKFYADYGIGSETRPGNISDLVMEIFIYMTNPNEDISDDEFMQSVLEGFRSGEATYDFIDGVKKGVIYDVLYNGLLDGIVLRMNPFFSTDNLKTISQLIDLSYAQFMYLIDAEPSYKSFIDILLAGGVFKQYGNTVDEIVGYFVEKYVTPAQAEGTGNTIANIIEGIVTDTDPVELGDSGYTYVYDGPIEVIPGETGVLAPYTTDFRLPSLVALTRGADGSTEMNISWYTRYSVTGGDIEIYEASEAPVFTGKATDPAAAGIGIKSETAEVQRRDFGVDVGVFGVMDYYTPLSRHIINLTGLRPGAKYYYRIGDAAKGWWSKVGTFSTSDGGAFTFFHMTDSQSQTYDQYVRAWAQLNASALKRYPDAAFTVHTGDFVDNTDVLRQWQWALDSANDTLMNLPIQPASGNHENFSSVGSTAQNFAVPNLRETQDISTGVSYSFDYSNAHFMVLNTEDLSDEGLSVDQYNWLVTDCQASDAQWKIVAMHKSIYSNGDHVGDDDVVALRSQLSKLFYELGIDLVISGHDHVYMRTDAMKNNKVVGGYETKIIPADGSKFLAAVNPDGTYYSINGTAGVKSYETSEDYSEYFPEAAVAMPVTDPVFSSIMIDGESLVYVSWSMDTDTGKLSKIDSFAIEKEQLTALRGDVDNDGEITAADARLALRHCLDDDTGVLKGRDFLAADADMDNVLTAADARLILRVAIDLEQFDPKYITMNSSRIGNTEPEPEPTTKPEPTSRTSILDGFSLPEGIELTDLIDLFVKT